MDENETRNTANSSDQVQDEAILTLGGRHRAGQVRQAPDPTIDSLIHTENLDLLYTKDDRAVVRERLNAIENPVTRRELRRQDQELYKKEHPIKHLGYRALFRLLKPFSK